MFQQQHRYLERVLPATRSFSTTNGVKEQKKKQADLRTSIPPCLRKKYRRYRLMERPLLTRIRSTPKLTPHMLQTNQTLIITNSPNTFRNLILYTMQLRMIAKQVLL